MQQIINLAGMAEETVTHNGPEERAAKEGGTCGVRLTVVTSADRDCPPSLVFAGSHAAVSGSAAGRRRWMCRRSCWRRSCVTQALDSCPVCEQA